MRAVIQRVARAEVRVAGAVRATIDAGLLVYLGIAPDDGPADVAYIADKVRHLRIFPDAEGAMNVDIAESAGAQPDGPHGTVLLVSAFTVMADARKGRRPAFIGAAPADAARCWYDACAAELRSRGLWVECGAYGEDMHVDAVNDGPVCILLDSRRGF